MMILNMKLKIFFFSQEIQGKEGAQILASYSSSWGAEVGGQGKERKKVPSSRTEELCNA